MNRHQLSADSLPYDVVRLRITLEADRVNLLFTIHECPRDTMPTVHQAAVGRQNHRIVQVGGQDSGGMLGHLSARRGDTFEPAILVELRDVGDADSVYRQAFGCLPQSLGEPERTTAWDGP